MTDTKRRATANEKRRRIRALRIALQEAVASGVQSASISGAGNSQSYTRLSRAEIRAEIAALQSELQQVLQGSPHRRTSPDFDI